jgi:hypothetical protein
VTRTKLADGVLADLQDGLGVWRIGGNDPAEPGDLVLGTRGEQAIDLQVAGQRVLRLEPGGLSPNLVGGHPENAIGGDVAGAVIGGGGSTAGVNRITGNFSTIGGGINNTAAGSAATVEGNIAPAATLVHSLGTPDKRWHTDKACFFSPVEG